MIIDGLLMVLDALVMFFLGAFPTTGPGSEALTGFHHVTSNLSALNYFLPISETFTAVFAAFMLFPALMGTSLLLWLVSLLRGGSARG